MQTHNGEQSHTAQEKPQRRYDIDWLRVIAILAIFFYHCSRFFGPEGWHLKNAEQVFAIEGIRAGLIWMWVMELFFLLSGVGSWYALKSRTAGQYVLERVKRLLIPLYTVGLLILIPPQFYFEIVTNDGFTGTFWESIPRFFGRLGWPRLSRSPFSLVPFPLGGHLWFLQYLFLMSLVLLPLLLYLKSASGQRLIATLAGWCERRGGILFFVIPIALVQIGLKSVFKGRFTWADFCYYAVFFVIGYMIPADARFTESIKRHGWVCLPLWFAGFSGIAFFIVALDHNPYLVTAPFSLIFVLAEIVVSITSWSAVVFMLSLGAKYLNFKNRLLAYAGEAVLPFYIFHQTIILCVGWFVLRWDIGILPKYLIIAVMSFALIMGLYELLVRRFNVLRFFFGMRPKRN